VVAAAKRCEKPTENPNPNPPPTQINESEKNLSGLLLYRRRRRREKRKGKKGEELGKRHKITKRVQIGGCPSRLWIPKDSTGGVEQG